MKELNGGNSKRLTIVLVGIILVLILLVLYAFVLRPSLNGYAVQLQNEGVAYTLNAILTQIQQNGYVQIPVSENQSLILVPYQAPAENSAPLE